MWSGWLPREAAGAAEVSRGEGGGEEEEEMVGDLLEGVPAEDLFVQGGEHEEDHDAKARRGGDEMGRA